MKLPNRWLCLALTVLGLLSVLVTPARAQVDLGFTQSREEMHTALLLRRAFALREKELAALRSDGAGGLAEPMPSSRNSRHYNEDDFFFGPLGMTRDGWDYGDTEPILLHALTAARTSHGPAHPEVALAKTQLAALYADIGDYAQAEPLFRQALDIEQSARGGDPLHVASILTELGSLYAAQNRPDRATPLLESALSIAEADGAPDHPIVASTLLCLASLHLDAVRPDEAWPLLFRARAIRRAAFGENHPLIAPVLRELGRYHLIVGDIEEAVSDLTRAVDILDDHFGLEHPDAIAPMMTLAEAHLAGDHIEAALEWTERALYAQDRNAMPIFAAGPEERRRAHATSLKHVTDAVLTLHIRFAPQHPEALRLALTALLRRKDRLLDAWTDMRIALRRLGAEGKVLAEQLTKVQGHLAETISKRPDPSSPDRFRARAVALDEERRLVEREVARRSIVGRTISPPLEIEDVQSALPEGTALVEFTTYRPEFGHRAANEVDSYYVAYVLHRRGITFVDLGEATEIDRLARGLRRALADPRRDPKPLARSLDAYIMEPIRRLLGSTRRVLIAPDGELSLIPFGALIDEQGRYLLQSLAITYLTTGRDLLRPERRAEPRQGLVIVAAPDFDRASHGPAESTERGVRHARGIEQVLFPPLPYAAAEANEIGSMWPDARVLTGAGATEEAVKAMHGPEILHLATHGFFLAESHSPGTVSKPPWNNPLLRGGLALAGANRRHSIRDDGVLTALEVSALDLVGTKLVILSGCETGLGDATTGEGVGGLRRAFAVAGAETQVMSLWPVDDEATRTLMVAFYQRLLDGQGRSQALRQAALGMMERPPTAHPYYWAGFLVLGNGAALDGRWEPLENDAAHPAMENLKVLSRHGACACTVPEGSARPFGSGFVGVVWLVLGAMRRRRRPARL